jgi:hypothetical protein
MFWWWIMHLMPEQSKRSYQQGERAAWLEEGEMSDTDTDYSDEEWAEYFKSEESREEPDPLTVAIKRAERAEAQLAVMTTDRDSEQLWAKDYHDKWIRDRDALDAMTAERDALAGQNQEMRELLNQWPFHETCTCAMCRAVKTALSATPAVDPMRQAESQEAVGGNS